jgi:hypothetical protein
VLRDGSPLAQVGPTERSFVDTSLPVGSVADYAIVTETEDGPTPPSSSLTAGPLPAHTFTDVGAWYEAGVRWLDYHEIAGGYPDATFRGGRTASRAQLAMMLWRMAGQPDAPPLSFADVTEDRWYAPGIAWAADRGLVTGFADGTFGPDRGVTRGQALAWLWGLVGNPPPAGSPPFTDVPDTAWNAASLAWAAEHGVVLGFVDGTFRSSSAVTRAQLALWLHAVASTPAAWAASATPPCAVAFPTDPGCEP